MQRIIKFNLISQTSFVVRRPISIGRTASFQSFNVQDQEDFQKRVLNASTPVLVDFHAKYVALAFCFTCFYYVIVAHKCYYYRTRWCGPCKTLGPRLEALAAEKLDKFHLAKVDIDNIPELAEEYNVCSPSLHNYN